MSEEPQSSASSARKVPVGGLAKYAGLSLTKQKNINIYNPTADYKQKSFLVKEFNRSTGSANSIFYHQPTFLQLSIEEKLKIIQKYHIIIQETNYENQSTRIVFKYNKPIIPRKGITFNDNLSVDWKPEDSDDEKEKNKTSDDGFNLSNTRPKRHVKRQIYTELLDSDDEDKIDDDAKPSPPKKAKTNDFGSSDDDIKWLHRPRKITSRPPIALSNVCDRTNKLFDALKKQDDKKNKTITSKSSFQKYVDDSASSNSEPEEDFFQKQNVNATVHKEQSPAPTSPTSSQRLTKSTPKPTKISVPTRRLPVRTRNGNNKYSSIAKTVPSSSKQIDNSIITASSFYGDKSSDKLDEHNNNKTNKSDGMIACPICSQLFPKTEIEVHASKCDQFQDSPITVLCEICNNSFSELEIATHRTYCIQQLTDAEGPSNENMFCSGSTKGFLCEICLRYLIGVNEIEHASNCISSAGKDVK